MRILFLTHRLPVPPDRGDRIRAHYLLREMSRFAEVSLFSFVHDAAEEGRARDVPFASHVGVARVPAVRNRLRVPGRLFSSVPVTHILLDAPCTRSALERLVRDAPPDLVVAYGSGMARLALEAPLAGRPFVLDLVDVDSAKWAAMADRSTGWRRWLYRREAATLGAFEARASGLAEVTLLVNDRELASLARLAPAVTARVIPNGIDVTAFRPPGPPAADPIVVFCGVMNYEPNAAGVRWFARDVWPLVKAARPDARFTIVGAHPGTAVRALGRDDPSIEVTGHVPAVQPYLWRSAVAVAPLHLARGLQNKVLEALAAGLPVVATPVVLEGLPEEARGACLEAATAEAFARQVIAVLGEPPGQRRARAAEAPLDRLSWAEQLRPLEEVLRSAAGLPRQSESNTNAPRT